MAGEIEYREYRAEDAASFLRLHDAVFPPISAESWQQFQEQPSTVAVALEDGQVVGAVPFHMRTIRLGPNATVPVAWEYSVGVREDLRGRGVGSRLMETARGFLRGRCPVMAVYRGEERSDGYRYYARAGHEDLSYARRWSRPGQSGDLSRSVSVEEPAWPAFLAREDDYLAVFESAYGGYAGYPQRSRGYYAQAVQTPMYAEVPLALSVLSVPGEDGTPASYAILGLDAAERTLQLMELAARGNNLALAWPLFQAGLRVAAENDAEMRALVPDSWPYRPLLQSLGFRPEGRAESSMMVMAHVLDPESLAATVWRESETTAGLEVSVFTPARNAVLHRSRGTGTRALCLEMKEHDLTRLLMGRLDLRAAYAEESVTASGAGEADIDAIAQALPFTPWAYHHLDYI